MKLVIIESPYKSHDVDTHLRNIEYARKALLDSLNRGEAPYASHLLYTQVLDDSIQTQRGRGMSAGMAWYAVAEWCAVYEDYGISEGMQRGIDYARGLRIAVEFRKIGML